MLYTKANIEEKDGKIIGIASTSVEDRQGEIVDVDGWQLKRFKQAPRLLWAHDHKEPAIGKVTKIWVEGSGKTRSLNFEAIFQDVTEKARAIKQLVIDGFINTFSVGFKPLEMDGNRISKQELLEISVVNVPANAEAMMLAVKTLADSGFEKTLISDLMQDKGTGSRSLPAYDDKGRGWDGSGAVSRMRKAASGPDKDSINWGQYARGFAWHDTSNTEDFSSYKLPFADVTDGELKAVWRGVTAAMAALMGARGGVDMPDSDRSKAYSLLAAYYRKFDEEPPELKFYDEVVNDLRVQLAAVKDTADLAVKGLSHLNPRGSKREIVTNRLALGKIIAKATDKLLADKTMPRQKTVSMAKVIKRSSDMLIRDLKGDL